MLSVADFRKKQIIFLMPHMGDRLTFSNDNIVVKDKGGKIKYQSSCYRLFMLCIVGNISLTSGIIMRSKKFGFSICMMNGSFRMYEMLGAKMEGNTLLRRQQYAYDELDIGRFIEKNKIANQKQMLKHIRRKTEYVKEGIEMLTELEQRLEDPQDYLAIMGIEGNAARIYFPRIFETTQWKGRKPRIKSDYINATLDIGYTMLFNLVDAILNVYGFDTYYGVFHRCFYMRKSLVCDIMEPMRPIIDHCVRKAINLGQFKEEDFEVYNKRYCLSWKNNGKYIQVFMETLLQYKDEIFLYIQSYYRYFMKRKSIQEMPFFDIKL